MKFGKNMSMAFLLFIILLLISWPLALIALLVYPILWLFLLPFRILGFAVEGILGLIKELFLLPSRIIKRV
jgi:ABC-type multidrug transport system fused ATPase/permease subunit